MTDEPGARRIRDKDAIAELNNYLVLRGWYLQDGLWTHEKLPATAGVDATTAESIQHEWDASV